MSGSTGSTLVAKLQGLISGVPSEAASPLHWKSAILLVRLLQTKEVSDMSETLPTTDGNAISFKEILDSRVENVERRNGSVGTDYIATHKLAHKPASEKIDELKKLPAKAGNSWNGKKGSAAKAAENTFSADEVLQLVAELMKNGNVPVASQPAEVSSTESVEEIAEAIAIEINVGDVVSINGQLRQVVSTDGGKTFRLNKSIV